MISSDLSCKTFKIRLLSFSLTLIMGIFLGLLWQELMSPIHIPPSMSRNDEINLIKADTDEKLLKYVEGKWRSSIGDLLIDIDETNVNGKFIVIENLLIKPSREEKYKIVNINRVDGFFGLVHLDVCNINDNCNKEDVIPIQINKIFGIDKTIAISYDTRLAYCVPVDHLCTRSFKEIE